MVIYVEDLISPLSAGRAEGVVCAGNVTGSECPIGRRDTDTVDGGETTTGNDNGIE